MASLNEVECTIAIKCDDILDLSYDEISLMTEDESAIIVRPSVSRNETGDWLIKFTYTYKFNVFSRSQLITRSFSSAYGNGTRIYATQPRVADLITMPAVSTAPHNGILYFSINFSLTSGATAELDIFAGSSGNDLIWLGSENILNYTYDFGARQHANYCLFIVVPPGAQNSQILNIYKIESAYDYFRGKSNSNIPASIAATIYLKRQI